MDVLQNVVNVTNVMFLQALDTAIQVLRASPDTPITQQNVREEFRHRIQSCRDWDDTTIHTNFTGPIAKLGIHGKPGGVYYAMIEHAGKRAVAAKRQEMAKTGAKTAQSSPKVIGFKIRPITGFMKCVFFRIVMDTNVITSNIIEVSQEGVITLNQTMLADIVEMSIQQVIKSMGFALVFETPAASKPPLPPRPPSKPASVVPPSAAVSLQPKTGVNLLNSLDTNDVSDTASVAAIRIARATHALAKTGKKPDEHADQGKVEGGEVDAADESEEDDEGEDEEDDGEDDGDDEDDEDDGEEEENVTTGAPMRVFSVGGGGGAPASVQKGSDRDTEFTATSSCVVPVKTSGALQLARTVMSDHDSIALLRIDDLPHLQPPTAK